jgi:hypothetical protein
MEANEMQSAFERAQRQLAHIHNESAQFTQTLGYIISVFETTKPYWVQLAAESGSNATVIPILESGKATVTEMATVLDMMEKHYTPPISTAQTLSLSASFFGSNTAATSSLVHISENTRFSVQAIPHQDFTTDMTLASRFSKLDPALGRVCAEIWESLYGTTSDPARTALFMLRQTWDHFFQILAPDEEVRNSEFWRRKDGPKPDQVEREERFRFAVARRVRDENKKALLSAACKQMLTLYGKLNGAHKRGEIDSISAKQALNSMYLWLTQWADALEI